MSVHGWVPTIWSFIVVLPQSARFPGHGAVPMLERMSLPANRDRTVEIVCGVSQKVDTSIGPLLTVRPKTYRVAHA
jgi:hypothetical protein